MAAVGYTSGDPRKVDVAGDAMTGALTLPGNPATALVAAPKQYVDATSSGGASNAVAAHSADTTFVHGIADTALLETLAGAQAKADAALADATASSAQILANLGDLTDQATARDNLGLTGVVLLVVGDTPGTLAAGDDWRFTDPRVPQAHASTHAPGGDDALENLTSAAFAPTSVDGLAAVAALRTLGTGGQQAASGSHTHTAAPGNSGAVTLDFGAWPGTTETSAAVTGQTGIAAGTAVHAFLTAVASGVHTAADAAYAALWTALTCTAPAAGGFTIHARTEYPLTGTFQARWVWAG